MLAKNENRVYNSVRWVAVTRRLCGLGRVPHLGLLLPCKNIRVLYADMAELADAYGSGPYESNFMQVQVLLSAPHYEAFKNGFVLFLKAFSDFI